MSIIFVQKALISFNQFNIIVGTYSGAGILFLSCAREYLTNKVNVIIKYNKASIDNIKKIIIKILICNNLIYLFVNNLKKLKKVN